MIAICVLILMVVSAIGTPLAWDKTSPEVFLLCVFCFLISAAYFFIRRKLR